MREIKFRAWIKKESRMTEVQVLSNNGNSIIVDDSDMDGTYNRHVGMNKFELMQYTGLKDKSGKEIYEGDIVKNIFWKITDGDKGLSGNQEIVFNDGGFYVRGGYPKGLRNGGAFNHYPHNWEIIGNIHENPELLK